MSHTYRNFLMQVSPNEDDDFRDGKSVRKHVVKQRRLQTKQKLRNLNLDELDNDWMEDF